MTLNGAGVRVGCREGLEVMASRTLAQVAVMGKDHKIGLQHMYVEWG